MKTVRNIYKANSIEEALRIASKLQKSGRYDIFRGQARNWPVISSLHREGYKHFESNRDRLERLYYFLSTKKDLKMYLKDVHAIFAIAQHYGIPTPYIDFTFNPEIAAYFATNSEMNRLNEIATIICANSKEFYPIANLTALTIGENDLPVEFVKIDVANLWRLQAQEGCFLYSPFAEIDSIYQFDRIEFPFTHNYQGILRKQIYPDRKSSLEILLGHYFHNERLIDWHKSVKKFLPKLQVISLDSSHNIFDYLDGNLRKHSSWSNKKVQNWHMPKLQHWKDVQSKQCFELKLNSSNSYNENYETVFSSLLSSINSKILGREFLVNFVVTNSTKTIKKKDIKHVQNGCNDIWDGMRELPYSDEQIAKCIARYISLYLYKTTEIDGYFPIFTSAIYIAMSCHDGSNARAHVCGHKVLSAIRSNINIKLAPKYKDALERNPIGLLQCINVPQYLFKFQKLCDLFAEDIIPTQVIMRADPVYFNPSNLKILGLA